MVHCGTKTSISKSWASEFFHQRVYCSSKKCLTSFSVLKTSTKFIGGGGHGYLYIYSAIAEWKSQFNLPMLLWVFMEKWIKGKVRETKCEVDLIINDHEVLSNTWYEFNQVDLGHKRQLEVRLILLERSFFRRREILTPIIPKKYLKM